MLAPALAREVRPRYPIIPSRGPAEARPSGFDLRPTYTLRGYTPADHFSSPEGIAVDERNRIVYVADTGKGRVVAFSFQGLPKFVLEVAGISAPRDLVVDEKGRLFVADKDAPIVRAVDAQGKTVLKMDLTGASMVGSPRIRGLAVDRQGRLYVGDQAGAQVLVCDTEGHVLSRIGSPGDREGQLKMIEDVALDRVGRIYVVDSVGTAVNVFDPQGRFIFRFGRISADQDDLRSPASLAIDRHDQLWVVDQADHAVRVFDGRGFALRRFGGDAPGSVAGFLFPSAVATDDSGSIYIAEKGASQVQVFALSNPFLPFRP
jgi:DNA-binding beta-propeller fold protein YncE